MTTHPYQQPPDYGHHQTYPPQQQQHQDQYYDRYDAPLPDTPQHQHSQYIQHQYDGEQQEQQPPPVPAHQYSQPQRPQPQPTQHARNKSRGFSFRSEHSDSPSSRSHQETPAQKHARGLEGKADPTLAMSEAEPAVVAQMEAGTLRVALRDIEHKDLQGNPISDPDRSNPTRNRWERPLDTIRSFEAAIDGSYHRKSMLRSDSDSVATWNRRSSYYGHNGPRFPQDSYYGGRPVSTYTRPDSMMHDPRSATMMTGPRDNYYEGYENGRNRFSRMNTDSQMTRASGNNRNVYPTPQNHQSYETVASGSGSGSYNEPAGYQTDPTSSENSSINRRSPPKRQEPVNDYGISFQQGQGGAAYQPPSFRVNQQQQRKPVAQATPPALPRKDSGKGGLLRKVSKAGFSNATTPEERPGMGEKRKSWFARRFSKA